MIVCVASVHHTGTNFVWQELLKGWNQVGAGIMHNPRRDKLAGKNFLRIHCEIQNQDKLKWWTKNYPTIVPLRHPARVAESWKVRDKAMHNLEGQWFILRNCVFDPIYLPIDVEDRQDWLDKLNERLGLNIQTDWPVIMSRKQTATLDDREQESVSRVMADGFFSQFGYGE